MEIKAGEFRNINAGLNEILQKELPVKQAYWLARFLNKLDSEEKAFEKARINLVTKHAKKDDKGKPLFKKDKDGKDLNEYDIPDLDAFTKEFELLIEEKIEIEFTPIKLSDLGDIKIKPIVLAQLEKIIIE
jgi:hypothetical protein